MLHSGPTIRKRQEQDEEANRRERASLATLESGLIQPDPTLQDFLIGGKLTLEHGLSRVKNLPAKCWAAMLEEPRFPNSIFPNTRFYAHSGFIQPIFTVSRRPQVQHAPLQMSLGRLKSGLIYPHIASRILPTAEILGKSRNSVESRS